MRPATRHGLRYAFYPGCLVLQRMPQYELSTKRVLARLGITLHDLDQACCCGAPVVESFTDQWLHLAAYNLALAEQSGLDVLTVCGSCTNTLLRARAALQDPAARDRANGRLSPLGLRVTAPPQVKHLLQVLMELQDALMDQVLLSLPLKVALTYPCQVFRPGEVAGFDDPLQPQAMHTLAAITGVTIVETGAERECCGSSYTMSDETLALAAGRRKLQASHGADVLVDACGNCQLLLERMQRSIWAGRSAPHLPILFLPQLLGLALGFGPQELGMSGAVVRLLEQRRVAS